MIYLGVDTSNYTTSIAAADDEDIIINEKIPLSVKPGERGLRQNDAVFAHVKNLPKLFERIGGLRIGAVGYSAYPRDIALSYMPCFEAGAAAARSIASINNIPSYPFSHQAVHIAAAIHSAGAAHIKHSPFLAFHVSGGTTELLYISDGVITPAGRTLDINAGQAIDRIGVMLGLHFPFGPELEALAGDITPLKPKICVRELDCNLSGLENKVSEMLKKGYAPAEAAAYTVEFIK